MRMRKKKHLEEKLAECGSKIIYMDREDKNFVTSLEQKNYIDYKEIFGNDNPVQLEVGCGKGQFICELARQNPDINYLAVEKASNVIVDAAKLIIEENIPNVIFLRGNAEYLNCYIPDGTISRIYLNFSCPFPKKKYACHRLTNSRFLNIYKQLMTADAEIYQKTDNRKFFEYSIEEFSKFGFILHNVSLDLHNSDFEGNIVTEYEKRFSEMGFPIYRLEAYLPQ